MKIVTDFLPRYRELNALFAGAVNGGVVSYEDQKTITEFYRQFSEVTAFEKMLLDIVLEKDKPTCALLLSGIKTEVDNNIRLYESARKNLDAINIIKICKEQTGRYNYSIEPVICTTVRTRRRKNSLICTNTPNKKRRKYLLWKPIWSNSGRITSLTERRTT